jgi:hypothetical protein
MSDYELYVKTSINGQWQLTTPYMGNVMLWQAKHKMYEIQAIYPNYSYRLVNIDTGEVYDSKPDSRMNTIPPIR